MTIPELYKVFLTAKNVVTDSRKVEAGDLFFALKGENFDGNTFAGEVINKGAIAAIIDNSKYVIAPNCILTDDALKTLQQLANYHRAQLQTQIIGITGSNGKTTTKELVNAVLKSTYKTFSTKGNYNNHIGVPLSLLSIEPGTEFAVIEMGANHIGEIAFLCEIAQPDFGIITNIGKAHLEGFGGPEGVKKAKGELYDFLRGSNGTAFINIKNELLLNMAKGIKKIILYGNDEGADCEGRILPNESFLSVEYAAKHGKIKINTNLVGAYNFENVMAAICVGNYFKIAPERIKQAIEDYKPDNNRSQVIKKGTNFFILDAYNANPSSMSAALENFSKIKARQKIVVLGEMMELGVDSVMEHQQLIEKLKKLKFDHVWLVGHAFKNMKDNIACKHFEDVNALKEWFKEQDFHETYFLIKGSRKNSLEKLLDESQ